MREEKKSKIKVLFVTATTQGGGAERILFNIINSLDDNHQSRLFITSNHSVPDTHSNKISSLTANKKHASQAFPALIREIRKYKPDYAFTTSSNIGYLLILARIFLKSKFKIFIRCAVPPSEVYSKGIRAKLLKRCNKYFLKKANLIIAQTEFMRKDLIDHYKLNPCQVKTIRNIIDKDFVLRQSLEFKPKEFSDKNYNILAAGALYSVKGFDLLIEAIIPVIKDTNKHLYIIGDERYEKGYKKFLENKIKALNGEGNIHLLGFKKNPYPYFKFSDLFVLSSRKEGYPNVVLESLFLDTPVVVTNVVDWSGVITSGLNGLVCQKNDLESLSNTLKLAFHTSFKFPFNTIDNFNYNELFK